MKTIYSDKAIRTLRKCKSEDADRAEIAIREGLYISESYDLFKRLMHVLRGNLISGNDIGTEVFLRKDEQDKAIAVAIYNPFDMSGYSNIQVYVKPEHRKKGLGTSLIEEIKAKHPQENYNVALGEDGSGEFWHKVGMGPAIFNERGLNEYPEIKSKSLRPSR